MRVIITLGILLIASSTLALAGTWRDDFEDGNLDGWKINQYQWMINVIVPDIGNWVIEDGAAIGGDGNNAIFNTLYMGEAAWTDYTAEVSVKLSKELRNCPEWTTTSLMVRMQEHVGCYSLVMQNYAAAGGIPVEGGKVVPAPAEAAGGHILRQFNDEHIFPKVLLETKINTWYRLKIEVNGDLIKCFIDGKQVSEFRDLLYTSGTVGFSTCGVVAMFDDFLVTGPKIPNGGSTIAVTSKTKLTTAWGNIKDRQDW